MTAAELFWSWEEQQRAFIECRNQRTDLIVRLVTRRAAELDRPIRVLDVGCGPGSLSKAILAAIPDAIVLGLDRDPVLLRLAEETCPDPERGSVLDVDLRSADWLSALPHRGFDAAVSATALHWLEPDELGRCYISLAAALNPGGIFLNADHLLFNSVSTPWLAAVADSTRDEFLAAQLAQGVLSWDDWWEAALAVPGWEAAAAAHRLRWSDKHNRTLKVSVEYHLEALRAAGFIEVGQVWQFLDDRIIFGRIPDDLVS